MNMKKELNQEKKIVFLIYSEKPISKEILFILIKKDKINLKKKKNRYL